MRILVPVLLLVAILAPPSQADWAQFHGDSRRTGFQSGTAYEVYTDVWWNVKLPASATVEASPVVSSGVLIVAGWDKVVRAYDAASGKAKWNYTMTDKVVSTPAVASGRVYAVDVKGSLVSLDLQTGTKYATVSVGATYAPITAYEGKLFIGTEAGEMKAYDVKSSDSVIRLLWTFSVASFKPANGATATCTQSAGEIVGGAAVHNGVVYFGAGNNFLYAINEEGEPDGTTRAQWYNETGDVVYSAPAVDTQNSRVYFGSYDGKLRAFDLTKPNPATCVAARRVPVWMFTTPQDAEIRSSPASDGTRIYYGTNSGRVVAVSPSGAHLWNRTVSTTPVVSSPAVSDGIVVIGTDDKAVLWLNAANGTQFRQFDAQGPIKSSPAIDGNRTFVAAFDGTVYMFGPAIPLRVDLVVQSITGLVGSVSVVLKNQGGADAPATKVRLLREGTFLANVDVPAIPANTTTTVTYPLDYTTAVPIKAIVDPEAAIAESIESNNELTKNLIPLEESEEDGGGGGGIKIPGPGLLVSLLALALAAVGFRRRRE